MPRERHVSNTTRPKLTAQTPPPRTWLAPSPTWAMTRSLTVLPAHCERRVIDAIAWPQSVRLASWPTVRFATTTVTTVAPLTTIATTQKRHHLASSRRLPAPGSLGVRVARRWRRRCLGGTVTGGPAVTVYSPPMTRNRPELPGCHWGFETVNPVVAQ
jgi:hypothetical protein